MISRDHGQSFEEEDHEEEGYEESEGPERPTEPHLPTPNARDNEASALLISASDKAGMEGIDRERINAILLRESGNSTFMQRQRKMDENTNQKIADMKR
jgi:DNA polymerase kappa